MFREIVLHQEEKDLHRYLHRDETGQIRDYRMQRLTFGVRSSPFIATTVIQHLTQTHMETHPLAAKIILTQFYVDDCLSGAATNAEADHIRQQLCNLLSLAGMTLRKMEKQLCGLQKHDPSRLVGDRRSSTPITTLIVQNTWNALGCLTRLLPCGST